MAMELRVSTRLLCVHMRHSAAQQQRQNLFAQQHKKLGGYNKKLI